MVHSEKKQAYKCPTKGGSNLWAKRLSILCFNPSFKGAIYIYLWHDRHFSYLQGKKDIYLTTISPWNVALFLKKMKIIISIELYVKSLKEGWNMEFGPSLREIIYSEFVIMSCFGVHFESWVKLTTLDMRHSLIRFQTKLVS